MDFKRGVFELSKLYWKSFNSYCVKLVQNYAGNDTVLQLQWHHSLILPLQDILLSFIFTLQFILVNANEIVLLTIFLSLSECSFTLHQPSIFIYSWFLPKKAGCHRGSFWGLWYHCPIWSTMAPCYLWQIYKPLQWNTALRRWA